MPRTFVRWFALAAFAVFLAGAWRLGGSPGTAGRGEAIVPGPSTWLPPAAVRAAEAGRDRLYALVGRLTADGVLRTLFPALAPVERPAPVAFRSPLDGAVFVSSASGAGILIETEAQAAVHPVAEGWVLQAADDAALGIRLSILHPDGTVSVYGHLGELRVRPGNWVYPDDVLGRVRERSLYLALERDGRALSPTDVIRFDPR
ncbi:MAG: hypothetical protein HSCHL_0824 [Hydrogenibacillus schlegelii]|uniref:M23ase beta-sheet core domain-containing protein n=1 Tax=Hydrogenibacillus schlegelii TaxID=1484 RepID=A0A2T5GDD1_HYDSH|nr:M23 family metallopeptidase [Hydrogenibacillus schlegelii]PTQ54180.1 MAG: hypothetical protein HSCHL_0824 [Hydrogenibacillus schlegelii]